MQGGCISYGVQFFVWRGISRFQLISFWLFSCFFNKEIRLAWFCWRFFVTVVVFKDFFVVKVFVVVFILVFYSGFCRRFYIKFIFRSVDGKFSEFVIWWYLQDQNLPKFIWNFLNLNSIMFRKSIHHVL